MKKYILFSSFATGVLLWGSWPVSPLTFLLFVGFVPLLYLAEVMASRKRFFLASYLSMLIWNGGATWWICNSTLPGGIAAILANSLLMCIPLMLFFEAGKFMGRMTGYIAFIVFWMSFEYIHLNWQLSWPWLTLGNGFANYPDWVQWYEYTGTSGGSFWVLLTNILLFESIRKAKIRGMKMGRRTLAIAILVISLPFFISLAVKKNIRLTESGRSEVVLLQPNIDPYTKFSAGSSREQLNILVGLSDSAISAKTKLVVWPETALNNDPQGINLAEISADPFLLNVRGFLARHPGVSLLSGIEGVRFFTEATKDEYSRKTGTEGYYYDSYNAAALFDSTGASQIYNKSKLVPGVETLPSYLKFMDKLFEQFGGTTGGYASQKERTIIADSFSKFNIAPAICYESIYGEFLTTYVKRGANLIVIITNDGWWQNTSGHKQHMHYARLRAIETRRWVARSANTGISCFISPEGEIVKRQAWDTRAAIKMTLPALTGLTFYASHGDLISPFCSGIAVVIILQYFFMRLWRGRSKKN